MNKYIQSITIPNQKELENERQWIESQLDEIGESTLQKLVQKALEGQKKAYIPYSKYPVGAAVLCRSGNIYDGCNAEVANYSITVHGEGSAITNAIVHGEAQKQRRFIKAVAIITNDPDIGPCGQCRQHIAEHCDNCLIIHADKTGTIQLLSSLKIILPYPFTPSKLGIK
ncbi:MAG TPA: cytidine deaminase [Candidatus Nitrosocosmicus sp.]|nr:cytidine deaminase [Candidatus Nitrosocosmicus sp.]